MLICTHMGMTFFIHLEQVQCQQYGKAELQSGIHRLYIAYTFKFQ
jgi:hypothetical protein